jgi:hypothetical protein
LYSPPKNDVLVTSTEAEGLLAGEEEEEGIASTEEGSGARRLESGEEEEEDEAEEEEEEAEEAEVEKEEEFKGTPPEEGTIGESGSGLEAALAPLADVFMIVICS